MAERETCVRCGTTLGAEDAACPQCGLPRDEALKERSDEEVTEASKESFPASDPPAY